MKPGRPRRHDRVARGRSRGWSLRDPDVPRERRRASRQRPEEMSPRGPGPGGGLRLHGRSFGGILSRVGPAETLESDGGQQVPLLRRAARPEGPGEFSLLAGRYDLVNDVMSGSPTGNGRRTRFASPSPDAGPAPRPGPLLRNGQTSPSWPRTQDARPGHGRPTSRCRCSSWRRGVGRKKVAGAGFVQATLSAFRSGADLRRHHDRLRAPEPSPTGGGLGRDASPPGPGRTCRRPRLREAAGPARGLALRGLSPVGHAPDGLALPSETRRPTSTSPNR